MRVFILLALIGVACAAPRLSNRIVGGENTTIENHPFMARMLFNSWIPYCGGTLITSTAVLSAAHCYVNDPPSLWKVRLGSTLSASGGTVQAVSKINSHPQYTSRLLLNDVAVIRLTEPAVFSDKINIARIAGARYILPDDTVVYAIGWGAIEYEGLSSKVLQHVAVKTVNHQICTDNYAYLKTLPDMSYLPDVTPEMLCTGILDVGGKDACQGDSGGPIIHGGDVVVGIISWGHECARPSYPGVNTRVTSYYDWIFNNSIN